MDVLITGGAGYLGAHLADRLLRLGHQVTIFDNLLRPGADETARRLNAEHDPTGRLSFVFRDVRDTPSIARAVAGKDSILHAASIGGEEAARLDPREDFATRVTGALNLLEIMRAEAPLAHLVIPSTSAVYGIPPLINGKSTLAAHEHQATSVQDPHASGAVAVEKYALAYAKAYGLKATVLRFSTFYGGESVHAGEPGWVGRLVAAGRARSAMPTPVDPRWPVDLLHIGDACRAAVAAWQLPGVTVGNVYNVGGGVHQAPSISEVTEFLGALGGRPALLPPIGDGRPSYVLDNTRFRTATGWEPKMAWREGLALLFHSAEPIERAPLEADARAIPAWPRTEGQA